jgi:hypothetical protein
MTSVDSFQQTCSGYGQGASRYITAPPPNAYNASRRGHAHGIPSIPFTIDGNQGHPVGLGALRDRPLHTIVDLDEKNLGQPELRIFTDEATALAALRERLGRDYEQEQQQLEAVSRAQRAHLGIPLDLTIWEHISLSGCAWEFDTNTDLSVLTNFDNAWACGFLAWGWKQLGTNASSFMVGIYWPFFGFRDRGGSTIGWALNPPSGSSTLWSGFVNNLVSFGWNDRAISITLPGATYP